MELLYQQFCSKMEKQADVFRDVHFENALRQLYWQMDQELNREKMALYIDYFMDCIRRDMQASLRSYKIYNGKMPDFEPQQILPMIYSDGRSQYETSALMKENESFSTDEAVILPLPWKADKVCCLLPKIMEEGFHQGKQKVTYYQQLGIITVLNGNHSLSVQVYLHQRGQLIGGSYDIAPLFPHVECSGKYWLNCHTGDQLGKIPDFRIAILYEAARQKFYLETQKDGKNNR